MSLHHYPGLWPGLAISVVIGFVVSARLGRAISVSRFIAWALVVGSGLAIAATLTPSAEAIRYGAQGSRSCDLGRLTLAPIGEILRFDDMGLNVVLFVPLGLAVGLAPRSRTKLLLIAGSVALPFAIEAIQLVATSLGRACQSADVVDNLTGLVIGLACGTVVGAVLEATAPAGRYDGGPRPRYGRGLRGRAPRAPVQHACDCSHEDPQV